VNEDTFPVEPAKPIPEARGRVPTPLFDRMRNTMRGLLIGGSFYVETTGSQLELRYIRSAAWHLLAKDPQQAGRKIKTRTVYENGTKGIRIWRTQ
jgi:hypothetical protein